VTNEAFQKAIIVNIDVLIAHASGRMVSSRQVNVT